MNCKNKSPKDNPAIRVTNMKYPEDFEPDFCDCNKENNCRFVLAKKETKNLLICIGVNPSKANKKESDATMNKLCEILKSNGYNGYVMLNLYPLINARPKNLPNNLEDKIYKQNLEKIKNILAEFTTSDILLCYGTQIKTRSYLSDCLNEIKNFCTKRKLKCLGTTKYGFPKHPLYLKKNTKIIDFSV